MLTKYYFCVTKGERKRKKRPERNDVYHLLKSRSADWVQFARELKVEDNYRNQLRQSMHMSSPDGTLEKVLAK